MFWDKEKTTQEKINELNLLIMTLENHEVKYQIVYNFSTDLIINITDKSTQRKEVKKETKKTKKEE